MEKSKTLLKREEVSVEDTWDLEKIYKNEEEFQEDFEYLKEIYTGLGDFKGTLKDPNNLLEYFKLDERVSRLAEKLYVYSNMKNHEDMNNGKYINIKKQVEIFLPEISSLTSFFVPELLSMDDNYLEECMKVPELQKYKFELEDILKMKPHTLSESEERILATLSESLNAPEEAFSLLTNADMTFPKVKDENGEEVDFNEARYSNFIKSKDRSVRKEAFETLFNTYKQFKNTLATTLTASINNFNISAKLRHFNSPLEASLKPNNIDVKVYDNTIDTVNKNLHLLHRYVDIKKRLLGLDEIHMYDLYVPLIDTPKEHIEFNDGVKLVEKALAPLGEEYLSIFKEGINNRWVDKYDNEGKRQGAYSWGSYDTDPYVLLNYNYDINDVSTLAHEMGHSIHSYYSRKNQDYIYSDYTLFCAEVASTTNEILFIKYMIDNEKDENKRLYLVNTMIEGIRTTVFRQTMFAEFEKITHNILNEGTPLNADGLCEIWLDLNKKYFGETMVVDEEISMEWARIPHFYTDFYVYQYATGYSCANSFANNILQGGEEELEKYKGFLKAGGSDYPLEILRKAGVDISTPKPIEDTMKNFEMLLDILETAIK